MARKKSGSLQSWLRYSGRGTLRPGFERLLTESLGVAELLGTTHYRHQRSSQSNNDVRGDCEVPASSTHGCSRYIVHWELRETMKEWEVETVVQRGLEKFPGESPRIISDNGPQFIARDFKTFVRLMGMTHVRTSPYYPQSNGKLERWHGSLLQSSMQADPNGKDGRAESEELKF